MAERMDQRNTPTPAETIRIATRLKALGRDMDKAAGEVSRVRGEISGVWRDYKKMGGEKDVLQEAIRLVEMDEDEAQEYVKAVHEHAAILGRPLWTPSAEDVAPGGLFNFDDDADAQQASGDLRYEQIKSKGFKARAERNAPKDEADQLYEPGSADHDAWTRGWIEADEADFDASKPVRATPKTKAKDAAQKAEGTEKPKRGRPPGSGKKKAPETAPAADPIGETQGNA